MPEVRVQRQRLLRHNKRGVVNNLYRLRHERPDYDRHDERDPGGNLGSVLAAGARNWAVVRAVCGADDPYSAILRLREIAAGQ